MFGSAGSNYFNTLGQQYANSGVYEASKAYLSMTDVGVRMLSGWAGYDQYEVSWGSAALQPAAPPPPCWLAPAKKSNRKIQDLRALHRAAGVLAP